MNYGDLGNWGLDDPDDVKIHLNFIGRAKEQIHQMRAQRFSKEQLCKIRNRVSDILKKTKIDENDQICGFKL